MVQKCSNLKVLEVFFREPTTIHFIKEISRKIKLAHTSVRKIIKDLLKDELIIKKESKPFDGYVANRENSRFLFYKRVYNLYSLCNLVEKVGEEMCPRAIVLFGSYSLGEDVEGSDIDILLISKAKKELNLEKLEKTLMREINLMIVDNLKKLNKNIQKKVFNGIVLQGVLDG